MDLLGVENFWEHMLGFSSREFLQKHVEVDVLAFEANNSVNGSESMHHARFSLPDKISDSLDICQRVRARRENIELSSFLFSIVDLLFYLYVYSLRNFITTRVNFTCKSNQGETPYSEHFNA